MWHTVCRVLDPSLSPDLGIESVDYRFVTCVGPSMNGHNLCHINHWQDCTYFLVRSAVFPDLEHTELSGGFAYKIRGARWGRFWETTVLRTGK